MTYRAIEAPLLLPDVLRTVMRSVGQRLLEALAEEECLYQKVLRDEDFEKWKASRNAAERLAADYTATVKLYLEAIRNGLP
jgi:hypothetical protein